MTRYVDHPQHTGRASVTAECLATVSHHTAPMGCDADASREGRDRAEIERFALEHGSDAVVRVRPSRLQPGRARVLRSVLERAPCPVLVLGGPETPPPRRLHQSVAPGAKRGEAITKRDSALSRKALPATGLPPSASTWMAS